MSINDILSWMESSALGQMMRDSSWLFPGAEILHFFGLCLLIGSLMVVDLRLLGVIKEMSYQAIYRFLPISLIGFGLNLFTGTLFCFTDPFRYYPNIAFRLKMLLVLLAGLNAIWFKLQIYPLTMNNPERADASKLAKLVAVLSLLFWFGVIIMGRMIPYLEE
jgi:hypothetical protein